ncbi:MAG: DUF4105 domain-containing protein, partial [Muribaculaceae bacterium]|nr:DUF4105 domain-containing protein [Muribaculaceae bacterium]
AVKRFVAVLFVSVVAVCVKAENIFRTNPDDLTISLITFFPGHEVYELEGHTALRIESPTEDMSVNWGMFNFNAPGFIYRFVKGETDYSIGMFPWDVFKREYINDGRRIVQQTLNLTAVQKKRLMALVEENMIPRNRIYRYNYVKDNCATRPLAIIERAIGDSLYLQSPGVIAENPDLKTFRDFMTYYHQNYPWYQFGIDLALGSGIDYELAQREMAFAPVILYDEIAGARIGSPSGPSLVSSTEVLNDVSAENAVLAPTPWYLTPTFIFWVLAIVIGGYCIYSVKRKQKYPRALATFFFALFGLTGLLLTFLIFVSVHEATSPNWNYLWLNPLAFVAVVLLWIPSRRNILKWYFAANGCVCGLMLVMWAAGVQNPNIAFIPLVLLSLDFSAQYLQLYPFRNLSDGKNRQ